MSKIEKFNQNKTIFKFKIYIKDKFKYTFYNIDHKSVGQIRKDIARDERVTVDNVDVILIV